MHPYSNSSPRLFAGAGQVVHATRQDALMTVEQANTLGLNKSNLDRNVHIPLRAKCGRAQTSCGGPAAVAAGKATS